MRARTAVDGLALGVPPLPNHLFTRDRSCWLYGGVSVNHMAWPARRREALHLGAIYRRHPLFAGPRTDIWSDDMDGAARLEGGDVLVLGRGAVLIGMGERARPGAVEALAQRLFEAGAAREVPAVDLPQQRSCMHLDTVLTMLDVDACTVYPGIVAAPTYRLTPGRDGVRADRVPALLDAIAAALGLRRPADRALAGERRARPGRRRLARLWTHASAAARPSKLVRDAGCPVLVLPRGAGEPGERESPAVAAARRSSEPRRRCQRSTREIQAGIHRHAHQLTREGIEVSVVPPDA